LLGLVEDTPNGLTLSPDGERLSRTAKGSETEAHVFSERIRSSDTIQNVAPGLLTANPPTVGDVARRMRELDSLSANTATHRARMLLKWRDVLVNRRMEFSGSRANSERGKMPVLHVRNFAQIEDARIEFGDLTILVGPQATGKSLLLQWFKAAIDMGEIFAALKEAGHDVRTPRGLIDLVFGEGMSVAWTDKSVVQYDSKSVSPATWTKGQKRKNRGTIFYIPAHRALLLSEGWPAPFIKLNADTPVVARLFSQNLYQRFSGRQAAPLFPVSRILKEQYRAQIDEAVFHGGRVELEKEGLRYRLRLSYADAHLPFMTWTAGQREFTPLLLGLYHVLPPRKVKKVKDIDWVIVEEPEMGLHPQAISVFMLLVLDLLWRGYRVVVSTHSPLILDSVWAIRQLREHKARWQLLSGAFGIGQPRAVQSVMEHALQCDYRVFFMRYEKGSVRSQDISGLDPSSPENAEAEWGGLTGFSSRFAEAVRTAVNEFELRNAS
jgi:putative AbiEii toxin of type IV toxin-antitoxin system